VVISDATNLPVDEHSELSDPINPADIDDGGVEEDEEDREPPPSILRTPLPMGGGDTGAERTAATNAGQVSAPEEKILRRVPFVDEGSPLPSDGEDELGSKRSRSSPPQSFRNVRPGSASMPPCSARSSHIADNERSATVVVTQAEPGDEVAETTSGHFERNRQALGISSVLAGVLDEAFPDLHHAHPLRRMENYDAAELEKNMTDDWPHLSEEAVEIACTGVHIPLNFAPRSQSRRRGASTLRNERGTGVSVAKNVRTVRRSTRNRRRG